MSKHTQGPWRVGIRTAHSKRDVYGPLGELVVLADAVFTDLATAQANAAYIVRACNAHEDLVKALEELIGVAEAATALDERDDIWERDTLAIERANNALALARGNEQP